MPENTPLTTSEKLLTASEKLNEVNASEHMRPKTPARIGAAALVVLLYSAAKARASTRGGTPAAVVAGLGRVETTSGSDAAQTLADLTAANGMRVECEIASALCSNAVCTLNSDKLTASCGCLKMPASATDPAQLALGWSSFILADAPDYQAALQDIAANGSVTSATATALCAAAESGELWPDISDTSYISLYSNDPMSNFNPDSGAIECKNAMCASCMGAPCYDKEYDANYDVTCVCPVTGDGIHCAFAQEEDRADGHLCEEVSSDEASCAASTGGSEHANISHTWTEVQKYVDAILYANPDQGNSTQCPSNGVMNTKFEANSTDYVAALNSTGDAANATGVPAGGRR